MAGGFDRRTIEIRIGAAFLNGFAPFAHQIRYSLQMADGVEGSRDARVQPDLRDIAG